MTHTFALYCVAVSKLPQHNMDGGKLNDRLTGEVTAKRILDIQHVIPEIINGKG